MKRKIFNGFRLYLLLIILSITVVCNLFFAVSVFAQDLDSPVSIEIFPEVPRIGAPLRISLLVDHSGPDEVTVIPPQLFDYLFIDKIIKTPRISDSQIKTLVEYILIPNALGIIPLEPFTINTPTGISKTPSIIIEVQPKDSSDTAANPFVFKLAWEGAPRQTAAGERVFFSLRVKDFAQLEQTKNSAFPPQEFFMPEVPQGAIFKTLNITSAERDAGIATKFFLIPLDRDFDLPARIIRRENNIFEIPALRIRVTNTRTKEVL